MPSPTSCNVKLIVFVNSNPLATYQNTSGTTQYNGVPAPHKSNLAFVYRACWYQWQVDTGSGSGFQYWGSPSLVFPDTSVLGPAGGSLVVEVWDLNPDWNQNIKSSNSPSNIYLSQFSLLVSDKAVFTKMDWSGGNNSLTLPGANRLPSATRMLISSTDAPANEQLVTAPNMSGTLGGRDGRPCAVWSPVLTLTFESFKPKTILDIGVATFQQMTYTPQASGSSPVTLLYVNDPDMIVDTN